MPLSNISAQTLLVAAAAQRAAYGDDPGPAYLSLRGLLPAGSSWIAPPNLLATNSGRNPNGDTWTLENGYFKCDQAAAFAAKQGSTLVISFRGSQSPRDFSQAALNLEEQVRDLHAFIKAVVDYVRNPANGIAELIVTGHSLGGELAETFVSLYADEIMVPQTSSENRPLAAENIYLITFGSPGVPETLRNIDVDLNGTETETGFVNLPDALATRSVSLGDPAP